MEGSSPVFKSGVGEEKEYAAAVQGRSSSGGFTHESNVSQLLSQVQQQSSECDKTLEEENKEEEEEQEEGNSYQEPSIVSTFFCYGPIELSHCQKRKLDL
jgi:hypothetical protein